jgi:hypothetical protein
VLGIILFTPPAWLLSFFLMKYWVNR